MRNPVRTPKQKRPRTNTHGNSHRAVLPARSRVAAQPYADIGHMARNRAPTRPASPKPKQTPDVPAPQGPMIQTHGQSASAKPNPGESSSPTRHLFHCPPPQGPMIANTWAVGCVCQPFVPGAHLVASTGGPAPFPKIINHNADLGPEIPSRLACRAVIEWRWMS